ncbi:MAG TPA: thioredoxin-dependent thiol peroxidase [Polyangiaceae bacterium]|nr:thioredoxin-dependent thiol peroxidase [Polyangiaceae bacterium]
MAAKKKSAPAKSKSKAKPAKPAKPAAKKAPAKKAPAKKVSKHAKPAAPAKAKPAKAAAPQKAAKPAKVAPAKAAKPANVEKPSLAKTVKRAAAKVAQVVASAAMKVLDADAGRPAPAFDLTDEKGEHVSSTELAGKPYLLYFYPKDDTPGCTKEACDIRDNFGRFGQQGLRVLGVSPDSTQSHAKFGKKYGLPFTLLSDPDKALANAYGVWAMKKNYGKEYMGIVRSSFLVGADGMIKKAYRGVRVDGHVAAILEDAKALL